MKKGLAALAVLVGALGAFLIGKGFLFTTKKAVSVSVIGGADGPTSVFLAGKVADTAGRDLMSVGCTLLVVCIISAVAAYIHHKKQK